MRWIKTFLFLFWCHWQKVNLWSRKILVFMSENCFSSTLLDAVGSHCRNLTLDSSCDQQIRRKETCKTKKVYLFIFSVWCWSTASQNGQTWVEQVYFWSRLRDRPVFVPVLVTVWTAASWDSLHNPAASSWCVCCTELPEQNQEAIWKGLNTKY